MNQDRIAEIIARQREYFNGGHTRSIAFRKEQLRILERAINSNEEAIMDALAKDMSKPAFEAYIAEIGILYPEIRKALRKVRSWAKPRRVLTPLVQLPATSVIYNDPYGVVLIIGPWNYPFQLTMAPLIGAIAAGNCALVKPSELAPETAKLTSSIVAKCFDPAYITVVEGGVPETQALLKEKFDYIFFTGGTAVGRIIMEEAAKHLTPVTLELGGKSPVIVHHDARLHYAARRIAWGKFLNAGQTCLAPDYLLVHRDVKEALVDKLRQAILSFYGTKSATSPDYPRIINDGHFDRISALMESGNTLHGGDTDRATRYIAPTIIDGVTLADPVMKEEIFGPLLPVLEYEDISEALAIVNNMPSPLALYLFTSDRSLEKRVLVETAAGGGCINDTLSHVGSTTLPFGGIGESGMGSYHGKASFDTFTHRRSIMKRSMLLDPPLRYPPYDKGRLNLVRKLFRFGV